MMHNGKCMKRLHACVMGQPMQCILPLSVALQESQSEIQVAGRGALKRITGEDAPVIATTHEMFESF